ncbi:peptidylprolyl isomerase [Marinobacter lipolyticus]|uniref:peptidylprolyl isomerase n=1 Tax=Marinobacter lipolyticus TaxID=209639 RepID=UPI001BD0515F|nr:peptidylprolyl isomerase [Marinobacter lipolyticus]
MKHTMLMLTLSLPLVFSGLAQADEPVSAASHDNIGDPDVFATVNGTTLGTNLYHFLLGTRAAEHSERLAYDDGFDAEMNRQQTAKDLVMTEVLAQQATRLGMHESERVKVEMAMAEKTLLAQLYVKQLMDTIAIDETEIRRHYDQQREQAMYRFMIWRTPHQAHAVELLNALKAGNDPGASGEDMIETPWLRDTDIAPEVNDLVRQLGVDEFASEPVFQDGYWKVVQVIDSQVMAKQSYEEARDIIRAELVSLKLDEKLAELADNAAIVFNDQYAVRPTN